MPDNSPRQSRRTQTEPSVSLAPSPKVGSANQAPAILAEARQLELVPQELPVVEVVDDAPARRDQEQAEPVQEQQTTADQLAPLQQQVAAANQQAQEHYRARTESDQRARQAEIQRADANRVAVENGLQAAKARADAAEQMLADAHSKADGVAIAKATRLLTAAERDVGTFETQKTQWDAYVAQQRATPVAPAAPVVATAAETMTVNGRQVDLSEYTPAERTWIRANPEYVTDATFNQLATTAANMALKMGYTRDSQDYIDYIASQAKPARQAATATQQEAQRVEPRKPVSAAAPVSRSASPQAESGREKLTLSRTPMEETNGLSEVEAAEISYPNLPKHEAYALYAQDREALIKERHPGMAAVIQRRA